ncbi:hypothetical protein CA54_56680 [Symmachiella macrocystis]|uniref:Uncharacterized protein n=1 Tax=Symmachiella macrocystis TaxID=2527985 RepID=A0A5C6B524_9PLAN|nr:hypothetical protein CA54_56680 [Symmachiella macrocystis]
MRPCQHCGKAIQLSDTICPLCDGEQVASVGLGVAKAPASGVRNDHTLDQRQKEIQWYPESWSMRRLVIVTHSINAGLILFGYLIGGAQGVGWAMSLVALYITVGAVSPIGELRIIILFFLFYYFVAAVFLTFSTTSVYFTVSIYLLIYLIVLCSVFRKPKPTSVIDLGFSFFLAAIMLAIANGVGAFYCLLKLTP